jgi:hypothetical protein
MTKYKKSSWAEARAQALTELQVSILNKFIMEDATLSSEEKQALQAKVVGLHNNTINALGVLQWAIGGANFNSSQKVIDSTAAKLDTLYNSLKTSRYEDIRNALDQQAKKQ